MKGPINEDEKMKGLVDEDDKPTVKLKF